jgi:hypothetical protein
LKVEKVVKGIIPPRAEEYKQIKELDLVLAGVSSLD